MFKIAKDIFGSKVYKNASWLIMGSMANKIVAFIVGVWTARHLGPSNFGIINYALAYTAFFFSLCTLGINSVIIKEFIDVPDEEGETLGTTIVLQVLSSVMSVFMITGIVFLVDFGETDTLVVSILCSIGLVFQMIDVFRYWFQARLMSKYYAVAALVAYIVSSLYKVVLIINGAKVYWFALATSVDYIFYD
ncbi:MAG: oligosaccharide flippase family protein, partial [Muribaculaceae bacterium]|nr:oligosaccharide flippase family protein [Muribaculaceae bacterium]